MAECSYARCVQERRNIRRELQKWTKNMAFVVGLERVAEELMGRRKWKLYQESLTKSSPIATLLTNQLSQLEQLATTTNNNNTNNSTIPQPPLNENSIADIIPEKDQVEATTPATENEDRSSTITPPVDTTRIPTTDTVQTTTSKLEERLRHPPDNHTNANVVTTLTSSGELIEVRDWSPSDKCLFCVDGKLDSRDSETPLLPGSALSPQASDSETSENSHSDTETPPHPSLPALAATLSPHLLNNNNPNMTTIESVHSMAVSLAAVAALTNNNSLGANPPMSFYPPGFLPPWYFNSLRNFSQEQQQQQQQRSASSPHHEKLPSASQTSSTASSGGGGGAAGGGGGTSAEMPLDLSSKASSTSSGSTTTRSINNNSTSNCSTPSSAVVLPHLDPTKISRMPPGTPLDTKHIFNIDFRAKPRISTVTGRRTYTEDELQAALRDIQSGKLGTRRAAVIYGIPRSTLRNKVYKLAMERERENHLPLPLAPVKLEDEETVNDEKELSGDEEEKEVEKALQKPLLSMDDILRFSNLDQNSDSLKHLLQKGEKDSFLAGLEPSRYIQSLLMRANSVISGPKEDMKLPEMVQKMLAEDQQLDHHDILNNGNERSLSRQSSTNSVIIRNDKIPPPEVIDTETNDSSATPQTASDSPSNVILKIPSFKPTTSKNGGELFRHNMLDSNITPPIESNSPPALPNKGIMSLKDVIAKSISQKFQQSSPNEALKMTTSPDDFKRGRFTPPMGNISVIKNHQDMSRYQPPKPQQNNNVVGGKGTRPKRGKYRNYDRDSLVEAVRAVQRGEMSVHRAGSYYGVPHSTLEYKVKERHLMRPRKRDPKPQPTDDGKITSPKDQIRSIDKNKPQVKPPQKFPPTSPNGLKMPMFDPSMAPMGYNHPPFPFWAHPQFHPMSMPSTSGFPTHPDLFATQMMQRLQDNSPASTITNPPTNTREIAESLYDGTGANGNFLDGIIRSSLEMGINKGQQDNTPEQLSNKALLEQLCRNNRLTPLPQKGESSGDESSSYHSKQSPINFSVNEVFNKRNDIVELSNDSNDSTPSRKRKLSNSDRSSTASPTPQSRIYVKPQFQELTKPENLKPEVLVRYSRLHENSGNDSSTTIDHVPDRNGIKDGSVVVPANNIETSASTTKTSSEAGQD